MRRKVGILAALLSWPVLADPVALQWDAVDDPRVAYYELSWGAVSGTHQNLQRTPGLETEITTPDLAPGVYFFGVRACDAADVCSDWSNEATALQVGDIPWPTAVVATIPAPDAQRIVAVPPCRIVDTRFADPVVTDFSGARLGLGESVSFNVRGASIAGQGGMADCGVPESATGVFVNVVAASPSGVGPSGFLSVWPAGQPQPNASTLNYSLAQNSIANQVLLALCNTSDCARDLSVYNFTSLEVHLVLDVMGYLVPLGEGV